MKHLLFSLLVGLAVLVVFPSKVQATCTCRQYSCKANEEVQDLCTNPPGLYCCTISNPTNPPAPTATPKPIAAPTSALPTSTPYPTTLPPNATPSPYWEKCGAGWCGNGYYCCQNKDNSPACCPVGSPAPTHGTGSSGNPTNTPTPTPTTPTPTPIPTPGPWIKLKAVSFYGKNNLINNIPLSPAAYDADDTTEPFFIIAGQSAGLAAAPSISLTGLNPSAKANPAYWMAEGYSP